MPSSLSFDEIPPRIGDLGPEFAHDALGSAFDLLDLAAQVIAGSRDRNDADRRALPGDSLIQLRDRDIEALAQPVFQRADDLAPVLQRPRLFDTNFKRELGYGHCRN